MLKKIKSKLIASLAVLAFVLPFAAPVAVSAQTGDTGNATIQGSLCGGAQNLKITDASQTGTCNDTSGTDRVNSLIKQIINIISVIVGVVAVIMIIVGGFRYITSGGSTEKVTGAKNTILYALIGLIIVALAQIIVRFVLNKTAGTS